MFHYIKTIRGSVNNSFSGDNFNTVKNAAEIKYRTVKYFAKKQKIFSRFMF